MASETEKTDTAVDEEKVTDSTNNSITGEACTEEKSDQGGIPGTSEITSTSDDKSAEESSDDGEKVSFKVIFNKQKHDVTFPINRTVSQLKSHIQTLTGVPPAMQKIMYKGFCMIHPLVWEPMQETKADPELATNIWRCLAKDELTLQELKITKGAKIMVVGSTLNDVLSVSAPSPKELQEEAKSAAATKEPLSKLAQHKKVLDKYGKPEDAWPGIKNAKESLPTVPVTGMYNKSGGKVRLTFKLELDQLWIGTKERTDKVPMNSIKAVVSEAIDGHEEYHLLGIQLGPTEQSRYWIYWVPAQYVDAIKDSILGKWQYF